MRITISMILMLATSCAVDNGLCNQNPDTCPGRPIPLDEGVTEARAEQHIHDHYPGVVPQEPYTHCTYGHQYVECDYHAHLGALGFTFKCFQYDSDAKPTCSASLENFTPGLRRLLDVLLSS